MICMYMIHANRKKTKTNKNSKREKHREDDAKLYESQIKQVVYKDNARVVYLHSKIALYIYI